VPLRKAALYGAVRACCPIILQITGLTELMNCCPGIVLLVTAYGNASYNRRVAGWTVDKFENGALSGGRVETQDKLGIGRLFI
jgi:hypothetical protein